LFDLNESTILYTYDTVFEPHTNFRVTANFQETTKQQYDNNCCPIDKTNAQTMYESLEDSQNTDLKNC